MYHQKPRVAESKKVMKLASKEGLRMRSVFTSHAFDGFALFCFVLDAHKVPSRYAVCTGWSSYSTGWSSR